MFQSMTVTASIGKRPFSNLKLIKKMSFAESQTYD